MSATSTLSTAIARRYSTALFDLARDENALEAIERDVVALRQALADSDDLRDAIESPLYARADQQAAMRALREAMGLGAMTGNLLELMAARRRLFVLPEVLRQFEEQLAVHRGQVTAVVTSARFLSDAQIEALKARLRGSEGKDVRLDIYIDPALIGGLIVRMGSRMIDTSIRSKLNRLQTSMKEVG